LQLFRSETIVFQTNLDTHECLRRISQIADEGSWTPFSLSGYRGSEKLLYRFDGENVLIWKRIYYHNGFKRYFLGHFVATARGTLLEACFDMAAWTKYFMYVWFAFIAFVSIPMLVAFFRNSISPPGDRLMGLMPLAVLAGGVLVLGVGRLLSAPSEKLVVESLRSALGATAESASAQSAPGVPPVKPIG
jgi:hypothetical protein